MYNMLNRIRVVSLKFIKLKIIFILIKPKIFVSFTTLKLYCFESIFVYIYINFTELIDNFSRKKWSISSKL